MNELKGYYKVFRAGVYSQGTVTPEEVAQIADNYDTAYKKSPLTIDHQDGEALGWIGDVKAKEGELYVMFDELSDEARTINRKGKYRYPSVEIAEYSDCDEAKLYLRAVTLTNFNAVKNLPQLRFSEGEKVRSFSLAEKIVFDDGVSCDKAKHSDSGAEDNSLERQKEQKQNADDVHATTGDKEALQDAMKDPFKRLAKLLRKLLGEKSIEIQVEASEDSVMHAFSELLRKVLHEQARAAQFFSQIESLRAEKDLMQKARVAQLLNDAAATGRIKAGEIALLAEIGERDYAKLEQLIAMRTAPIPIQDARVGKQSNAYRDALRGKLATMTYKDVVKNPALAVELSAEELQTLRENE